MQYSQMEKKTIRKINTGQAAGAHCALMIYEGVTFQDNQHYSNE